MRDRPFAVMMAAALAALTVLCGACAQSVPGGGAAQESMPADSSAAAAARQAVVAMSREFPNLVRARNADSVAAWFAPDAIVLANGAPSIRGRDAIRTFYDQFFQAMPIRDMTFATESVAVSDDVAIETGTSSLSVGGPGQTTPVTVAGKYLAVWRRQPDGRWLVWRYAPSTNALPR